MRRCRRRGLVQFVFFLLLAATAFYFLAERALRPSLESIIRNLVQIRATEAINRAVLERVAPGVTYEDLYIIRENAEGLVTFLQPNTARVNRVAAQVGLAVQQEMKRMEEQPFSINLAQVFGSRLFATRGPVVHVSVQSIGTVRVNVDSRFEQAGMNQTRHVVYLKIRTEVQAVTPTFSTVYPVEETVPLVEGIIVGPIPKMGLFDFRTGAGGTPPGP